MANLKFKPKDILHVSDTTDEYYHKNSLYEVLAVISEGYVIRSLRNERVYMPDDMEHIVLHFKLDSQIQYIEDTYRLATAEEIEKGPEPID